MLSNRADKRARGELRIAVAGTLWCAWRGSRVSNKTSPYASTSIQGKLEPIEAIGYALARFRQ